MKPKTYKTSPNGLKHLPYQWYRSIYYMNWDFWSFAIFLVIASDVNLGWSIYYISCFTLWLQYSSGCGSSASLSHSVHFDLYNAMLHLCIYRINFVENFDRQNLLLLDKCIIILRFLNVYLVLMLLDIFDSLDWK